MKLFGFGLCNKCRNASPSGIDGAHLKPIKAKSPKKRPKEEKLELSDKAAQLGLYN